MVYNVVAKEDGLIKGGIVFEGVSYKDAEAKADEGMKLFGYDNYCITDRYVSEVSAKDEFQQICKENKEWYKNR